MRDSLVQPHDWVLCMLMPGTDARYYPPPSIVPDSLSLDLSLNPNTPPVGHVGWVANSHRQRASLGSLGIMTGCDVSNLGVTLGYSERLAAHLAELWTGVCGVGQKSTVASPMVRANDFAR